MHYSLRFYTKLMLKRLETCLLDSNMGINKSKYVVKANLNSVELESLVKSTYFNEEQLKNFYSSFIDDCPNGYLTKKDFIRIFKQLHPIESNKGKADKYCEYVFNAFDADSSGIINFSEFIISLSIASFGDLNEKCELAFKIFDLDKNHIVDRDEMQKVIESLYDLTGVPQHLRQGDNSAKSRVETIMKRVDANKDNVLNLEEFINGCVNDESVRKILVDPLFNC